MAMASNDDLLRPMSEFVLDADGETRLQGYFDRIGEVLGSDSRRGSYAVYAMGLFGDGERKSMEAISARACPDLEEVDAAHQRLQHFITDSNWSDVGVRREAASYALTSMTENEPVTHWILDDTGFPKSGDHSVGVQRQYTGTAGKITNCQVGVSLTIATAREHLPIDFELYLPRSWTDDPGRRSEARIPNEIEFRTKHELALTMIDRALDNDVPRGRVSVDSAYGNSSIFRRELRRRELDYAVAVKSTTKVWQLDSLERRRGGRTLAVAEYAKQVAERGGFRRVTWREGTNGKLSARFAARRVLPIADQGKKRAEREVVWLLMEWESGKSEPSKFYFITAPKHTTKKQLVRLVKQQWRIEHSYRTLKGELGLDHFEGRRFQGWHHHISVTLSCYAFIVAERARLFPPEDRKTSQDKANPVAARTPLPQFRDHHPTRHSKTCGLVAATLPLLPPHQRACFKRA